MTLRIVEQDVWSPRPSSQGRADASGLPDLRAVVMLAGAVRPGKLRRWSGRSALELPVGAQRTVMDCWREQLLALAETLGIDHLLVRVMMSGDCGLKPKTERFGPLEIKIEQDPSAFRGTAGLISDISRQYDDSDQVLVSHAGQLLFEPLTTIARGLAKPEGDVTIAVEPEGVPSGLMLVRCGAMRGINPVGFVDLNEQALPELAKDHRVKVARFANPPTRSVRTLSGYIAALRAYHRRASGRKDALGPFAEDWRPTFGITEPGAKVASDVVLHDSVVLKGARVEPGAVLVRSVICNGAVVASGRHVVDQVVGLDRPM
ncbi:MAG: hypothetical protein ACIAXF_06275 [Phycisphaerales bacterium JB063]